MLRSSILQYVPGITDIVCLFNWQIQVACGEAYNRMVAQVLLLVDFIFQSFGMANRKLYRDFQSMKHQLLGSAERVNPWGYIMSFPNGFIVMKIIIFSCIMTSSFKFDHYDCSVLWRSLESLTIFSAETSVVMIDISVDLIHDEEHRTGVIAVHLWYISLGSVSSFQGVQSYSSRLGVCKNYKFQCLVYYEQWFHPYNVLQGLMGESTKTQRWKDNEQLTPKHVSEQLFTVDRLHKSMLNDSLLKYVAAIILSDSGPYTAVFLWLIAWKTGFFTTLFRRNSDNLDPQGFPAYLVPASSNSGEYIWSSHITAMSHAVSNFLEYGATRDPIVGYSICLRITRPLKSAVLIVLFAGLGGTDVILQQETILELCISSAIWFNLQVILVTMFMLLLCIYRNLSHPAHRHFIANAIKETSFSKFLVPLWLVLTSSDLLLTAGTLVASFLDIAWALNFCSLHSVPSWRVEMVIEWSGCKVWNWKAALVIHSWLIGTVLLGVFYSLWSRLRYIFLSRPVQQFGLLLGQNKKIITPRVLEDKAVVKK